VEFIFITFDNQVPYIEICEIIDDFSKARKRPRSFINPKILVNLSYDSKYY